MNQNPYQENLENVLEKYGRNIIDAAKSGKIDPVIGRDEEIRSITRILSRKTKNNPVLIGEPGPLASMGFSRFPASILPSVFPAPTIV